MDTDDTTTSTSTSTRSKRTRSPAKRTSSNASTKSQKTTTADVTSSNTSPSTGIDTGSTSAGSTGSFSMLQNIVDAALQSPSQQQRRNSTTEVSGASASSTSISASTSATTPSTPAPSTSAQSTVTTPSSTENSPARPTPSPASAAAASALTSTKATPTRPKRGSKKESKSAAAADSPATSNKRGQKRKTADATDATTPATSTSRRSSKRASITDDSPATKKGKRVTSRTTRTTRGKHVRVTMYDGEDEDSEVAQLTQEGEETEDDQDYEDSMSTSDEDREHPHVPAHLKAPRSHIHPAFLRQNFNSKLPYMTTNVKLLDVGNRVDDFSEETWATLQKQFDNCLARAPFRRWLMYEWFYSSIDRPYFNQNEFIEVLEEYGFENMTKLTRAEWGKVRKVLGRPRRVSAAFFKQERGKLHTHRCEVRAAQGGATPSRELSISVEEIPVRLPEGQHVTALHPDNNELHTGTVVGHAMLRSASAGEAAAVHYRIKFERPELAAALIPDYDVMPHAGNARPGMGIMGMGMGMMMPFNTQLFDGSLFPSSPSLPSSAPGPIPPYTSIQAAFPHAEGDIHLIATLLKLLDRKKALVDHLHSMNTAAENIKLLLQQEAESKSGAPDGNTTSTSETKTATTNDQQGLPAADGMDGISPQSQMALVSFRQQYAWVIVQLEKTSQNLENALLRLRIRRSGSRRSTSINTSVASLGNPATMGPKLAQHCRAQAIKLVTEKVSEMMAMREIPVLSSLGSDNGMAIKNVISSCLTLIMLIQNCVLNDVSPDTVDFKSIIETLRPSHAPHTKHFTLIEESMNEIIKMLQTAYSERPHQSIPQQHINAHATPAPAPHPHHNHHSPDVDAMI